MCVCGIRTAQDRLVNYRHLLSKRAACAQVLPHEVRLREGVEVPGPMFCHVLLQFLP